MSTPAFVQYEQFTNDLCDKVHDLIGTDDTLKIALTNTAPTVATDAVLADISEIAAGFGYSAGGADVQNNGTESGGTVTVTAVNLTFLAAGGAIAQWRYMVLYNDTPSSPANPLIGYWDHGVAVDLANGESFDIVFGASVLVVAPA
jgi:hypothetical protein